tara:strand:+ start:310 stop:756 length:447 start_codon:yes stop_codon:yes gene_type:complete
MGNFSDIYLWFKACHVIAAIAWMAGLLYLPRLFVYHCRASWGSELDKTFQTMERRLLRFIMGPAMLLTWLFGLGLVYLSPYVVWQDKWFFAKLLAVIVMSAMNLAMSIWRKNFAKNSNSHSQRFYKLMNEVPTVLLILIVVLVIVKPF